MLSRKFVPWIVAISILIVSCQHDATASNNGTPTAQKSPIEVPSSVSTPSAIYLVIFGQCLNGDEVMGPATNALNERQYVKALDMTRKALAAYHNCASVHTGQARVINRLDEAAAWIYLAIIHHNGPAKTIGDWKLDLQNAKNLLMLTTSDPSANLEEKQWAQTLSEELEFFMHHKMTGVPESTGSEREAGDF